MLFVIVILCEQKYFSRRLMFSFVNRGNTIFRLHSCALLPAEMHFEMAKMCLLAGKHVSSKNHLLK